MPFSTVILHTFSLLNFIKLQIKKGIISILCDTLLINIHKGIYKD